MESCDVLVIGGGPGGYVAAIRAAQLGLSTVCAEMEPTLGGVCVNVGCIPSKALLTSSEHYEWARLHAGEHGVVFGGVGLDLDRMQQRKRDVVTQNTRGVEFLFRKNKVTWAKGRASLGPGNVVDVTAQDGTVTQYQAQDVIIATGSVPIQLPFLPFDEERILSNTGALALPEVPRHLIVIGGGVIGLELGSVWRRLGARVTVIELAPTILPGQDADIIKEADRIFRKQGMELRTGTRVTGGRRDGNQVHIEVERDGASETITGDAVLVAVGRRPWMPGIDAAALGLEVTERGSIVVDRQMRTNLPHVYAIGDVVGGKLLAHKAEEEGVIAAEVIAGQSVHMDYKAIPSIVYTFPEIATVGLAEHEAQALGRPIRTGRFPFSANGRARTLAETQGFVKFVADAEHDEILGCHIIGPDAADLLQEVVLAMEFRGSSEDIGITVHPHPTLSEAVKEAALAVMGRAIHI